jgi:DNA-binding MurR/RpiR family transcriptional regulator
MTDLATVRSRLEAAYQDMSRQQRRAARYVLNTPTEIALYPLRQIATRAGVGAATMVRLANSMGFASYNEFRELFRDGVRSGADRYYGSRAEKFISKRSGFDTLHRATRETLARSIEETFGAAPAAKVEAAGQTIAKARRLYILGLRSNYAVAFYFHYVLRTFLSNVVLLEDRMDMLIDELGEIGPRDALLVMSSEPYAASAVKAVEHTVKVGAAVIALTDSPVAPVTRGAKHVFALPITTTSFYQSMVSKMALIEAFVAYLFAKGGARAVTQVKEEFERRERFGIYWREQG